MPLRGRSPDRAQKTNCRLLQTDYGNARIMRRADDGEDLRVKASLARPAGQFDDEKFSFCLLGVAIGEKGEEMHLANHRADQTLDMAAMMGLAGWAPMTSTPSFRE